MRIAISVALVLGLAACGSPNERTEGSTAGRRAARVSTTELHGDDLPANTLAITYDDGPDASAVQLAQYLHDQGIPATFFVVGCRIVGQDPAPGWSEVCDGDQFPSSVIGQLVALGHRVGNHSQRHLDLSYLALHGTANRVHDELATTQAILDPYITDGVQNVRAPFHAWAGVAATIDQFPDLAGLIGSWGADVDAGDFSCASGSPPAYTPEECAQRYLELIASRPWHNGIVQLHSRLPPSAGPDYALRLTQALVSQLRADPRSAYNFVALGSPMTLTAAALAPSAVQSGATAVGTLTLPGTAPAGGAIVSLLSSAPSVASVPATVTVPEGASSVSFTVTTGAVTVATTVAISATLGRTSVAATLLVNPPPADSLTITPTSVGAGGVAAGTVTLAEAAPPSGTVVRLASSDPTSASVPESVTVPGGATSASFTVSTGDVSAPTVVVISAAFPRGTLEASVTVTPVFVNLAQLAAVTVSSENVSSGQLGTKAVDGIADGIAGPGGDYTREWATLGELAGAWIQLTWRAPVTVDEVRLYDRPNLTDHVLAGTLLFSDGSAVQVGALPDAGLPGAAIAFPARSITWLRFRVDAAVGRNIGLSEVQVLGPTVDWLSLSTPAVAGSMAAQGVITLARAAPAGGATVLLSSSDPAVASVPSSLWVPPGSSGATFTVTTSAVSIPTEVAITAVIDGAPRVAILSVNPALPLPGENLLTSPESIGDGRWAAWGGGIVVTPASAIAPDGTLHASRAVVPSSGGHALAQTVEVAPGTVYTASFYARNNGGTAASYSVFDGTNNAELVPSTSYFAQLDSATWTRISFTFVTPPNCTLINFYPVRDSGGPVDVLLWGAKLEIGSAPSRYLPIAPPPEFDWSAERSVGRPTHAFVERPTTTAHIVWNGETFADTMGRIVFVPQGPLPPVTAVGLNATPWDLVGPWPTGATRFVADAAHGGNAIDTSGDFSVCVKFKPGVFPFKPGPVPQVDPDKVLIAKGEAEAPERPEGWAVMQMMESYCFHYGTIMDGSTMSPDMIGPGGDGEPAETYSYDYACGGRDGGIIRAGAHGQSVGLNGYVSSRFSDPASLPLSIGAYPAGGNPAIDEAVYEVIFDSRPATAETFRDIIADAESHRMPNGATYLPAFVPGGTPVTGADGRGYVLPPYANAGTWDVPSTGGTVPGNAQITYRLPLAEDTSATGYCLAAELVAEGAWTTSAVQGSLLLFQGADWINVSLGGGLCFYANHLSGAGSAVNACSGDLSALYAQWPAGSRHKFQVCVDPATRSVQEFLDDNATPLLTGVAAPYVSNLRAPAPWGTPAELTIGAGLSGARIARVTACPSPDPARCR